jgi:hypothetical protein
MGRLTRGQRRTVPEYNYTHKVVISPNPNIAVPMIGIMKWTWAWADQPYQLIQVRLGKKIKITGSVSQYSHWYKE